MGFIRKALSDNQEPSSKRMMGFESFQCAMIVLLIQATSKLICHVDLELWNYFVGLLSYSAVAFGLTSMDKLSLFSNLGKTESIEKTKIEATTIEKKETTS